MRFKAQWRGGGGVIEQQPTPGALIQAAAEIPASKERGSTVPAVLGQRWREEEEETLFYIFFNSSLQLIGPRCEQ